MNKQYVIFDMDGTLVDSMVYWRNLVQEYIRSKGITVDMAAVLSKIKTMTVLQSTQYFAKEYPFLGSPEQMAQDIFELMGKHYLNDVQIKDGITEYLQKLKARGVKMCIATITGRDLMTVCLSRLGLMDYFDFILTGSEVTIGKNTPEMYLRCAETFGAAPEDIAVFEDTLNAITTAKEAGFYTVGIFDESEMHNTEAIKQTADEYINTWYDLI